MKLLLHTCCAPCSVYCIEKLRSEGIEPTVYWYNPNIHPYMEYKARRDCLKEYTKSINVEAIFHENYGLDEFCDGIKQIAEELAQKYNIEFVYRDFREGFREGQAKARELGLYMQKYCGCIFSEEDRYYNRNATKFSIPNGHEIPK